MTTGTLSLQSGTPGVGGTYNGLGALAFLDVPVVNGSVVGTFGDGQTAVMGGLTIVTAVPEPGTAALLGLAALSLVRRRRPSAISV
jgi:hypothetical protein